jgi:hypothetical protein
MIVLKTCLQKEISSDFNIAGYKFTKVTRVGQKPGTTPAERSFEKKDLSNDICFEQR